MNPDANDQELLQAVKAFTLHHPHDDLSAFKPPLRDWGTRWQPVTAARLPVVDYLPRILDGADRLATPLLDCFFRHATRLHWEQSYRREDGLVSDAMLDAYGFAEIIGARGPFVSDRIRAGLALLGPGVEYPQHRHVATEVYLLLSGSMLFRFDGATGKTCHPGDVILVDSNRRHGFTTFDDPIALLYLWRAGDLRQTSRFD